MLFATHSKTFAQRDQLGKLQDSKAKNSITLSRRAHRDDAVPRLKFEAEVCTKNNGDIQEIQQKKTLVTLNTFVI